MNQPKCESHTSLLTATEWMRGRVVDVKSAAAGVGWEKFAGARRDLQGLGKVWKLGKMSEVGENEQPRQPRMSSRERRMKLGW